MPQIIKKTRPFTADTGGALDWQIGFEDPNPVQGFYGFPRPGGDNYFGFLGIGNKKEKKARQDAMNDVRAAYPGPKNCEDAVVSLQKLRAAIKDSQRMIDSGESPNVAPRYVDAYNTVVTEYTSWYNTNCLGAVTNATTPAPSPVPATGNNDPILKTALPGVTTKPSETTTDPAQIPTSEQDEKKNLPVWALVAGGVALLGVLVLVIKKSTK